MFFKNVLNLLSATSISSPNITSHSNDTSLNLEEIWPESNSTEVDDIFDTRFFPKDMIPFSNILHCGRILSLLYNPDSSNGSSPEFCTLGIVDENEKHELFERLALETDFIREIPFEEMKSIIDTCNELDKHIQPSQSSLNFGKEQSDYKEMEDQDFDKEYYKSIFSGIVPGTKWCGFNDIAGNYHDLGIEQDLDRCCRTHDHCPIKVKAFQSNYGAFNFHPYTKSHCDCDNVFYDCLKRLAHSNSTANVSKKAKVIGNIYFNVIGIECIEPRYPIHCLETLNEDGTITRHKNLQKNSANRFRRSLDFITENHQEREEKNKCIKWTLNKFEEPKYFPIRPMRQF